MSAPPSRAQVRQARWSRSRRWLLRLGRSGTARDATLAPLRQRWRARAVIAFCATSALLAWDVPHAQAGSSSLVISEFRTRGVNSAGDEYIELLNLSSAPVNIGGRRSSGSSNTGTSAIRSTIPTNTIVLS